MVMDKVNSSNQFTRTPIIISINLVEGLSIYQHINTPLHPVRVTQSEENQAMHPLNSPLPTLQITKSHVQVI
jgi:hypothetical protein